MMFEPVKQIDCPLVDDPSLIDRFNACNGLLQSVESAAPGLLASEASVLVSDMKNVRERLTRKRYQVGFIGPFQIGKSSTFNNLTELPEEESPSPEGGIGAPTSSTVVRVRVSESANHTLKLTYLTPEQYAAKLAALTKASGFTGLSPEQLLKELPKRLEELHQGKASTSVGPSDYEYLQRLLASHIRFGTRLLKVPAFEDTTVPYVDRFKHLMHNRTDHESENMLLFQAEVGLNTKGIPPEVEMIDLPGLNSQGTVDSILTEGFLKELDAVLLLAPAGQIGNADTEKSFAKLTEKFEGRLGKRVWVVITKFDSLNKHAFHGDDQGDSIFDTVNRLLQKFRLSHDRVFLISNPIYKLSKRNPEGSDWPNREMQAKLEQNPGDLGDEWTPPSFKKYPKLCEIYETSLLKDGGFGRLRHLVSKELADLVREDVKDWARQKLDRIPGTLKSMIELAIRRNKLDADGIRRGNLCCSKLLNLIQKLAISSEPSAESAKRVHAGLLAEFNQMCPDQETLELLGPEELAETFTQHSYLLQDRLTRLCDQDLIPSVFNFVQTGTNELPEVDIRGCNSVQTAWEELKMADIASTDWRTSGFPTFLSSDLFSLHKEGKEGKRGIGGDAGLVVHSLKGRNYRELMEEKILVTSHQAAFAVCQRALQHVQSMNTELRKLLSQQISTEPGTNVEQLNNLRNQIQVLT